MVEKAIEKLNSPSKELRLKALVAIRAAYDAGNLELPPKTKDVNNHIHTTYSFSPYAPSNAIFKAYQSGLCTAGIVDHDSVSGAYEFIEAGSIMNFPTTVGMELRVSVANSPFKNININSPDQNGLLYVIMHAIPKSQIKKVSEFLKPINHFRGIRNQAMIKKLNDLLTPFSISLDYVNDVLPLSLSKVGGSVTERHLLFALAKKIIARYTNRQDLLNFLRSDLKLNVSTKAETMILDIDNPYFEFDLLGLLKAEFMEKIYIAATDECIDISEFIAFSKQVGAISCVPYLGDISDSVTGDKKAQKFEDDILDELFDYYKSVGFEACAYMPSRNTLDQLKRVQDLCKKHEFIQISGEDINQPRQDFVCKAARNEMFSCLYDSTWALIGSEIASERNIEDSIVSDKTKIQFPNLDERIEYYKQIGLNNF